jgi:hypothetical protein
LILVALEDHDDCCREPTITMWGSPTGGVRCQPEQPHPVSAHRNGAQAGAITTTSRIPLGRPYQ